MDAPNPTAFPQSVPIDRECDGREGMSLRDYFAGHAMSGILACSPPHLLDPDTAAELAYGYADAMLEERL